MDDAACLAKSTTQRSITQQRGLLHRQKERIGERIAWCSATIRAVMTNLHAQMREDIEEALFRFVESVSRKPLWQRRIQRGVKAGLKLSLLEQRWLKRDGFFVEMTKTATRWGKFRGPRMARELGVDIHDPRSLGKIQDWEDALFGVTGHWTHEDSHTHEGCRRATKHETQCPFAELASQDTRICTEMIHAMETETFRSVNPSYRLVPLKRLLSKGDASCTFTHEVAADAEPV